MRARQVAATIVAASVIYFGAHIAVSSTDPSSVVLIAVATIAVAFVAAAMIIGVDDDSAY